MSYTWCHHCLSTFCLCLSTSLLGMLSCKIPLSNLALIWSRLAVSGMRTDRRIYWLLRSILWYLQKDKSHQARRSVCRVSESKKHQVTLDIFILKTQHIVQHDWPKKGICNDAAAHLPVAHIHPDSMDQGVLTSLCCMAKFAGTDIHG